jgi:hypothetical protein
LKKATHSLRKVRKSRFFEEKSTMHNMVKNGTSYENERI